MVDISKHPILEDIYQAAVALEKCGASPELTQVSVMLEKISQKVDKWVDEVKAQEVKIEELTDRLRNRRCSMRG